MNTEFSALEQSSRDLNGLLKVVVTSFGYGHDVPFEEAQEVVYDVRRYRDPIAVAGLRERTARDEQVRAHVLATADVAAMITMIVEHTREHVRAFGDPHGLITRVAIGCGGGRHRAPVIASEVAETLNRAGLGALAEHRDLDKPLTTTEEDR